MVFQELADFEAMSSGPQLKAADLIRDGSLDGSGKPAIFHSFVAELKDEGHSKLIAYSIAYFSYSTWQGKSFFLEDIYVKPQYRKTGVGKKIFTANVKFALEENCPRFDFHVLNWNPAKKFYESLGAINLSEKEGWEFFRLSQCEMERLAASSK